MMKVMFLASVSKTRMDHKIGKYFNGEIGFYLLVEELHVKRNIKNRNKYVTYLSEITSFTKDVFKSIIIHKLIPSIVEVFHRDTSSITIQLDGSSDQNFENYMYIFRVIKERNLHIKL